MENKYKQSECVVAVAHDKQTQEYRSIIMPTQKIPPMGLMDPSELLDSGTIEYMIKQKIAKDGDLIDMDQLHFINWCVGYCNLPKKERSKLQVEAIVRSFDNLKDAENMLKQIKEEA